MNSTNVVLVGAGIASAALGVLLRELNPNLNIIMLERLDEVAKESSFALNNAGTGHAGYCELNYTPETSSGDIDMQKAYNINAGFQSTLHLLANLVKEGKIKNPENFITRTPHSSLVWGENNQQYLKKRYEKMAQDACFENVEFTQDKEEIKQWLPLCIEESKEQYFAATKIEYGTDVNFGAIATNFIEYLAKNPGFELKLSTEVKDLKRNANSGWTVKYKDLKSKSTHEIQADFVFLGAGGASLTLLQKTGLDIAKNYGGFPVGGQWLVCENPQVVKNHNAKVYGRAAVDALPMSMPHLDRRHIDGKEYLIFGPYAEFTTKFLKQGSFWDLFGSVKPSNFFQMADVGLKNMNLISYLISEATKTRSSKFKTLLDFYPSAKEEDWQLFSAGERVQIVKRQSTFGGKLILGTEVVSAEDGSLSAFLGASPGASVIINSMLEVVTKCFDGKLDANWQDRLKELVPTFADETLDVRNPAKLDRDRFLELQNQALKNLGIIA